MKLPRVRFTVGRMMVAVAKHAEVIRKLETVMDHYAANQLMQSDYVQAAVDQPLLFRTPPEAVVATVEAAVDRLEAQAPPEATSSDRPPAGRGYSHRVRTPSGHGQPPKRAR